MVSTDKEKLRPILDDVLQKMRSTMKSKYLSDKSKIEKHLITEEEPLAFILRGHLYIEAELIQIIKEDLKHPDEIDLAKVRFETLFHLTIAMGLLEKSDYAVYKKLNGIRNLFAHNVGMEITDKHVNDLTNTFTPKMQELANIAFANPEINDASKRINAIVFMLLMHLRYRHILLIGPKVITDITFELKQKGLTDEEWQTLQVMMLEDDRISKWDIFND